MPSKNKTMSLCHKVANTTGIPFNAVLINYYLEDILKHIAQSPEQENFIFKGGFMLSNLMGLAHRFTTDLDCTINNQPMNEQHMLDLFHEILPTSEQEAQECGTGIWYEIRKIGAIRAVPEYGGVRINLVACHERMRTDISLDIGTGDVITPCVRYEHYSSPFDGATTPVQAYPLETMLAEKFHAMHEHKGHNSRVKDFYDTFMISHMYADRITHATLLQACENTFRQRGIEFDAQDIIETVEPLLYSPSFNVAWKKYAEVHSYAEAIGKENLLNATMDLLNELVELDNPLIHRSQPQPDSWGIDF